MEQENINNLIRKYTRKDPEQDKKARAELERTNTESELLALQVMEKRQYLDYRKEWNRYIKLAFLLNYFLLVCITVMSLFHHWEGTLNVIVVLTALTQAAVLVVVNFIFPRSQIQ